MDYCSLLSRIMVHILILAHYTFLVYIKFYVNCFVSYDHPKKLPICILSPFVPIQKPHNLYRTMFVAIGVMIPDVGVSTSCTHKLTGTMYTDCSLL